MDETWDLSQGVGSLRWWYTPEDVDRLHRRVRATAAERARDPRTGATVVRSAGLLVRDAIASRWPVSFDARVQFAQGTVSEVTFTHGPPAVAVALDESIEVYLPRALRAAAQDLLERMGVARAPGALGDGAHEWTVGGCRITLDLGPDLFRLSIRRPAASRPG